MAWTNALKDIISDMISVGAIEGTKLPLFANTTYKDLIGTTNKVSIVKAGLATIGTYDPAADITYGTGAAGITELTCDQYFYMADKLDKTVKLVDNYIEQYVQSNLPRLYLKADAYALTLATKANFPTNWLAGAADAAIGVNSANILDQLDIMAEKLDSQNVDPSMRMLVVPPKIMTLIKKALRKSGLSVEGVTNALFEGRAEKILGFNVIESNQYVPGSGTYDYKVFFGSPDAFVAGLRDPQVEYMDKMENSFAESFKALIQFGVEVNREELGGAAYLKVVAEA